MFNEDRQFKSEMGRIIAQSIGGIVIKVAIAAAIIYVGMEAYDFIKHAFDPVSAALAGAK